MKHSRGRSDTSGRIRWPSAACPDVPTSNVLCRADRMLPEEWTREVVRARLGVEPRPALGGPRAPAERRDAYRVELGLP